MNRLAADEKVQVPRDISVLTAMHLRAEILTWCRFNLKEPLNRGGFGKRLGVRTSGNPLPAQQGARRDCPNTQPPQQLADTPPTNGAF